MQGDLSKASERAAACVTASEKTQSRKYVAWGHKLLGDIAALEDHVAEAQLEFGMALEILRDHPCPTVQWKILKAAGTLAGKMNDTALRDELVGRALQVVQCLADSTHDERLRESFLASQPVSEMKQT